MAFEQERLLEKVAAGVSGDAKFWENNDFDALFCSFGEHIDDVTAVKLAVGNAHGGHSGGNSDVS